MSVLNNCVPCVLNLQDSFRNSVNQITIACLNCEKLQPPLIPTITPSPVT